MLSKKIEMIKYIVVKPYAVGAAQEIAKRQKKIYIYSGKIVHSSDTKNDLRNIVT